MSLESLRFDFCRISYDFSKLVEIKVRMNSIAMKAKFFPLISQLKVITSDSNSSHMVR